MSILKTITFFLLFSLLLSCSEEKTIPEAPIVEPPVIEVDSLVITPELLLEGYSGELNRIGGGDYTKDSLFIVRNLPEGLWEYKLSLGSQEQSGQFSYGSESVRLANGFSLGQWLDYLASDSINVQLTLYSGDYPMEAQSQSYSYLHEAYQIKTWQDLQSMDNDKSGNYHLAQDIVFPAHATEGFPEQGFVPVGTIGPSAAYLLNAFKGSLTGYGYSIKNFCIDRSDLNYVGLFGLIAQATIKDVILEISDAGVIGGNYVGAIVGYMAEESTIENCKVIGNIEGLDQVGGIAGYMESHSSISLSRSTGAIQGNDYVGGIVGISSVSGLLSTNFVEGEVSGTNYVGGLVGYNSSYLYNSQTGAEENTTKVEGLDYVGGIAGYNEAEILGSRVINGSIEGLKYVGGIMGFGPASSQCKESCAKVSIIGHTIIGGLVGSNAGTIYDSYAIGDIEGSSYVGGLVGQLDSELTNCYASIKVSAQELGASGALIGHNSGTVSSSYYDTDQITLSRSVGSGNIVGVEGKTSNAFISFDGINIPREIFVGWDFSGTWENEVPLQNNALYPGLKREFNFE